MTSSAAVVRRRRRSTSAAAAHRSQRSATSGSVRRSFPMPACCDPWPGKTNAILGIRSSQLKTLSLPSPRRGEGLLGLDHLTAGVVAAVWADRVRALGLLAVWARLKLDQGE